MLYASDAATIGVEVVTQVISLRIDLPTPNLEPGGTRVAAC